MRSASQNPAFSMTVEMLLSWTSRWQTLSRTQITVSPCWRVPWVVDMLVDVQKACPLQLLHYLQAPKALNHCLSWQSVSLSWPCPGSRRAGPMDLTSGNIDIIQKKWIWVSVHESGLTWLFTLCLIFTEWIQRQIITGKLSCLPFSSTLHLTCFWAVVTQIKR